MFLQVKKELIAVHTLNMLEGVGRRWTYGALIDGMVLIMFCFDAGEDFLSWTPSVLSNLTGTFTNTRCAVVHAELLWQW